MSQVKFDDAVRAGRTEEVRTWLLSRDVDPAANDNWAIRMASFRGHVDVVRVLLADPRVDPAANYNEAIREASYWGRVDVVQLLLTDPRVGVVCSPPHSLGINDMVGCGLKFVSRIRAIPRAERVLRDAWRPILSKLVVYEAEVRHTFARLPMCRDLVGVTRELFFAPTGE